MKKRFCCYMKSTDRAVEAWDQLHEGRHEGDRRERDVAAALALAMIEKESLREAIAGHIRFCGLPDVAESFLPRLCVLRRRLEATQSQLSDLVQSDLDVALLLIRHPQVIDALVNQPRIAEPAAAEPVTADAFAGAALKRIP